MRDSTVRKTHERLDCSFSIVAAKVTVFFYWVEDTVLKHGISCDKHMKSLAKNSSLKKFVDAHVE